MKKSSIFAITGAVAGVMLGSSMGIASGGSAVNAAWVFGPIGAFIGWLISTKQLAPKTQTESESGRPAPEQTPDVSSNNIKRETNILSKGLEASLTILAVAWNFHIDLLHAIGILDTFIRQPMLFVGLCVVISVFFPPYLVVYFLAWLAANHFHASAETKFRAQL